MQSGPIKQTIYVRPPEEWALTRDYKRGTLWRLTKLPYGIVEASRQWQQTEETWMLQEMKFDRVKGFSQLFTKRDYKSQMALFLAKVTDDFLCSGAPKTITQFMHHLGNRFAVGKTVVDEKFHFNGCEVKQDSARNVRLTMKRYLERRKPIALSKERSKERKPLAKKLEIHKCRNFAGTLMYLGGGVLLQAAWVTSLMQQRLPRLEAQHVIDANMMVKELLVVLPYITYVKPRGVENVTTSTFSDVSHCNTSSYDQTGLISGFLITQGSGPELYHLFDWYSHKQKRVS